MAGGHTRRRVASQMGDALEQQADSQVPQPDPELEPEQGATSATGIVKIDLAI